MHIRENHLVGLENMFRLARKHRCLLMENWKRHEFMDDIRSLFDAKRLGWEKCAISTTALYR